MMRKIVISVLLDGIFVACTDRPTPVEAPEARRLGTDPQIRAEADGLRPDLRTVVPQELHLEESWDREILRFTNAIANTGRGRWHMKPRFPLNGSTGTQDAIQQIFDANGRVVQSKVVSRITFHREHNHWHIANVARYQLRSGSLSGPLVRNAAKTTFCLIDYERLPGFPNPARERYTACDRDTPAQGISVGWMDVYGYWLPGQGFDITGVAAGVYYLISKVNPAGNSIEANYGNNQAWVKFELIRDLFGPSIRILGHSQCSGGLCGS